MSELDLVDLAQIWLWILVVTDISLFGRLISNLGSASALMVSAAITAGVILLTGTLVARSNT